MAGIQGKRIITRLKASPVANIFLVILAGVFVYGAIGAYNKSRLAEGRMSEAEAENSNLEDQRLRLTAELENAQTEFGQEKALREKFNVVKKGEQVIVIVNKEDEEVSAEGSKTGFWAKIFGK